MLYFCILKYRGEYMKFTKMSLVAALLVGSSAFALENTKVSGDAKLYYSTSDAKASLTDDTTLFNKDNSAADIALSLDATTDVMKNDLVSISAGAGMTVLTTLGLENSLVSNVWGSAHTATAPTGADYGRALGGAKVNTAWWVDEAWVAATAGKTTLKLGRMELDTPLAFTETWSVEKNTFEAVVVLNQDIPDTTLVGAYVGNGNGNEAFGENVHSNVQALGLAAAGIVNANGEFSTFGTDGAFAAGIVNNSFKPLTVQAWYYDLTRLAEAYWLQADLNMEGILAGAQYTSTKVGDGDSSGTFAVMAGYEMKDMVTAKVAYSQTSDKGDLHGANTATGTGASKLYTEAWWNYGKVTQLDTSAISVSVESPVNGMVDLGLYVTMADQDVTAAGMDGNDLTEVTLTASKSFGPLDATVAYIYADANDDNDDTDDKSNTIQAYLTLNF